ncbi:MAG: LTA synthase family protein [Halieaceae bacterium]|nr:LTA synthase family protein [Halieaceae bacterium]
MRLPALFSLFFLSALGARLALHSDGYSSVWPALGSDFLWALLLALVSLGFHWLLSALLLLLWVVLYLGNLGFIQAMGAAIDLRDLGYLLDAEFLRGTLGGGLWPQLGAGFLAIIAIVLLARWCWRLPPSRWSLGQRCATAAVVAALLLFQAWNTAIPKWSNSGLVSLYLDAIFSGRSAENSPLGRVALQPSASEPGRRQLQLGMARNVILIVVEGVHGAYLPQVASRYGETPPVMMTRTGRWAERGWLAPDFLLHARQTNRGLYAMLCGDYPMLDGGYPKPMQILHAKTAAGACLPNILARHGYRTVFMQAADLKFMSKGVIMPHLGFRQVLGKQSFPQRAIKTASPFLWGPGDQAFYEQSLTRIESLHSSKQPFFATLLTVGTHHPYAVTAADIEEFGGPRNAAVAVADRAVDGFLQQLQARGILDDTLVMVTSDESHGIPGHWLGNNWGLLFALAPDLAGSVAGEVFSTMDIPNSILDYLGLFPGQQTHLGRSLFRQHDQARTLMFSDWMVKMLDRDGRIHHCARRIISDGSGLAERCQTISSPSGRLFERDYVSLQGDFAPRYHFFREQLLNSLHRFRDIMDWQLLAAAAEMDLGQPGNRPALTRHKILVTADSQLTVDFSLVHEGVSPDLAPSFVGRALQRRCGGAHGRKDAEGIDVAMSKQLEGVRPPTASDSAAAAEAWCDMRAGQRLQLEMRTDDAAGQTGAFPNLLLPDLEPGDSLRVRYETPNYGAAMETELTLHRLSPPGSGRLQLKNYRYALQPLESGTEYGPRVQVESANPLLAATEFGLQWPADGPGRMQPLPVAHAAGATAQLGEQGGMCEAREFSTIETRIIWSFLVYFDRSVKPAGLAYWAQWVSDYRFRAQNNRARQGIAPLSTATMLGEPVFRDLDRMFAESDEYSRKFGDLDTGQRVAALYRQLFESTPGAEAIQRYSTALHSGAQSLQEIAMDMLASADAGQRSNLEERLREVREHVTRAENLCSSPQRSASGQ